MGMGMGMGLRGRRRDDGYRFMIGYGAMNR